MAWLTVQDALRQSFRFPDMSRGTGVGLRGGRFTETFNPDKGVQRLVLHRLRLSEDVTVDGRVKVDVGKGTVTGRMSVTAPHGAGGTVRIVGRWFGFQNAAGSISVRGSLGGAQHCRDHAGRIATFTRRINAEGRTERQSRAHATSGRELADGLVWIPGADDVYRGRALIRRRHRPTILRRQRDRPAQTGTNTKGIAQPVAADTRDTAGAVRSLGAPPQAPLDWATSGAGVTAITQSSARLFVHWPTPPSRFRRLAVARCGPCRTRLSEAS